MQTIGTVIAAIHNAWLTLPLWLRSGIGAIVTAVVALALAFGWHFPTNWADAIAQVSAFWLLAVPTVVSIFKSNLLPYIVQWFLGTFGYYRPTQLSTLTASQSDRWVRI